MSTLMPAPAGVSASLSNTVPAMAAAVVMITLMSAWPSVRVIMPVVKP